MSLEGIREGYKDNLLFSKNTANPPNVIWGKIRGCFVFTVCEKSNLLNWTFYIKTLKQIFYFGIHSFYLNNWSANFITKIILLELFDNLSENKIYKWLRKCRWCQRSSLTRPDLKPTVKCSRVREHLYGNLSPRQVT